MIAEGWCVGFRALEDAAVEAKWSRLSSDPCTTHRLEDLLFGNERLRE